MGVLFYRDRLIGSPPCSIEYLHKWGQELTGEIDSVVKALQNEREATCSSQEEPESVLDGLNRVIVDTKWRDNTFKAIILVGDASPHPATYEKNPMKLDVPTILKQSGEKSIRFLNIKLDEEDEAFKNLALSAAPQNRGRYATIPKGEIEGFKSALLKTLNEEWGLLTRANQIQQDLQTGKIALSGGTSDCLSPDFLKKYRLTEYEALIICIRLPATADPSQALPAFLKGWVPEKIQGRLVASEFIFMDKSKLKMMTNTLDNIAEAALVGNKDGGPDAFISTVQNALASQLSMQPSEIFKSGETLDGILKKANILPFKTTVLVFSAQEIQSWKAPDYQRLNTVLSEKVKYLRELQDNASALHMFGDKPHLYVPRAFFP
jgi:hypothetical protein